AHGPRGDDAAARPLRRVRDLLLEVRDLALLRDDVGILVGVARGELGQLLAQERDAPRRAIRHRRQVDAAARARAALLPLDQARLRVAVHAQLGVHALDRQHVHLRLVGQGAAVALLVLADALLLLV